MCPEKTRPCEICPNFNESKALSDHYKEHKKGGHFKTCKHTHYNKRTVEMDEMGQMCFGQSNSTYYINPPNHLQPRSGSDLSKNTNKLGKKIKTSKIAMNVLNGPRSLAHAYMHSFARPVVSYLVEKKGFKL